MGSDEQGTEQVKMTKGIGLSDVQIGKRREVEELKERIAELEGQLAEANNFIFEMGKCGEALALSKAEKREAVLREALEWYADKNRYPLGQGNIITVVEDGGDKARAALEVK